MHSFLRAISPLIVYRPEQTPLTMVLPPHTQSIESTERMQIKCVAQDNIISVLESPWNVANRLHEQRTGALSWRPVLRPSKEHRPIPTRPYLELRTWKGGVNGCHHCLHLALGKCSGISRHPSNLLASISHSCHSPPPALPPPNPP